MGSMGFRCGYVGVPQGHPMHGIGYDDARKADGDYIDVHGGLTYANNSDKYPVEADLWWFGYDCGHLGDGRSEEYVAEQKVRYPEQPFMWYGDQQDIERSAAYCVAECESLARQLAEAGGVK